jgi:hypothetical protein
MLAAALPLALLVLLASTAAGQFAAGGRAFPGTFSSSLAELDELLSQAQGILLANDQYVAPPYAMDFEQGQLVVNDQPVSTIAQDDDERPRRWRTSPQQQARMLAEQIAGNLAAVQVVVALDGQPLAVISTPREQVELLSRLARLDAPPALTKASLHDSLPRNFDRTLWDRWMAEFAPTPEFVARAREQIELFERIEREANAAADATRRLHNWSYPLSLAGMIAAVLGFGHLLSHRPPVGSKALDIDSSPLAISVLTWSLALVVLYSALDLTWTILAYQAGQIVELNPLGSHLIEDPVRLLVFKAGATTVSVGLLFALRKYCKAQLAAWWICLILTLLTARWLVASSMFVV